ncbi:MAG TPA: hypothetical protein VHU21_24110 [Paraburkholderia sp.]|nr:hypothetical protein [Paraburkholderia sp.]
MKAAKITTAMPYLGIGYGLHPRPKGWGLVVDLGVAYGLPKSSYTLSPALSQAVGPAMSQQIINTGLQQLRDKVCRLIEGIRRCRSAFLIAFEEQQRTR